ncbi:BtrH N-terminal domain-containing protein [Paenibacillus sp. SYP-B3998]|uniref:BtrH N-terminal domain-containing protein n=1 Tax=Paenibacillus sp. SYP-B3998 TaxID=2678564 RepID=A0A6G3ZXF6_9BACL|nr:BtrH N-terminal domain-containing protein [Paenibacillus sp. SYP-B3998]NEW06269.1 BtrH N-terminal domain-containing protein [Paenibacillus sp. SYP-B3998]
MGQHLINGVPRYYVPYLSDCFATAYAAVLAHKGQNPNIVLAEYLNFMYDETEEMIGNNFLYRFTPSVEFTEAELNTSLPFVYQPATTIYSGNMDAVQTSREDKIQIRLYICDDAEVAHERLKQLIRNDEPLCTVVNLFEMHYHGAYKKEHGLHAIVVTGYDEDAGTLHLFDKYKISNSDFDGTMTIEEVKVARLSTCELSNPAAGPYTRQIRNLWMEIEVPDSFQVTQECFYTMLEESSARMLGSKQVLGKRCGLERIEAFRSDLLLKKESTLDERAIYMFKLYYSTFLKRIARTRRHFKACIEDMGDMLPQALKDNLLELLDETIKRWEIVSNVSLKLGITKKMSLLDDMDKHLKAIIELESDIATKLSRQAILQ